MKKNKRTLIIVNIAVLFLALAITFVTFPLVSKYFYDFVSKESKRLLDKVQTAIGLEIRYEQLSPSLLAKVNLKNVRILDENGTEIAHFEKVLLEYKLLNVIKGDFKDSIRRITIRDGVLTYDKKNKSRFFETLFSKSSQAQSEDRKRTETSVDDSATTTKSFELPVNNFNVSVQNVRLNIATESVSSTLMIYSGKFAGTDGKIAYSIQSNFSAQPQNIPQLKSVNFDIKLEGNTVRDLSALSAVVSIQNFAADNFKISGASFFLSREQDLVSLLAFQRNSNFDIKAAYNLGTKIGNASISFEKLRPFNLANVKNQYLRQLTLAAFNGSIAADFDLNKDAKELVAYNFDISADVPQIAAGIFSTRNFALNIKADGTEKLFNIKKLAINSTALNLSAGGFYNFANGVVRLDVALNKLMLNDTNIKTNFAFSGNSKKYAGVFSNIEIGQALFPTASFTLTPRGKELNILVTLADKTGEYNFDAVYTSDAKGKKFVEAHGVLNSVSIQNIYQAIAGFAPSVKSALVESRLEPFRATSEFYITSDLKSFSYNVIQLIAASTEAGGMYLLSSFDGNNEAFNLQNFNLNVGKKQITGTATANFAANKDIFFNLLFSVDAISYSANGIFSNNMLNIYGDYGLSLTTFFEGKTLKGNFTMKEFPVPAVPFVFSINANFDYLNKDSWNVICDEAKLLYSKDAIVENYTNVPFQLTFKGNANPKSIFLSQIEMGNNVSMLKGQASFDSISNDYDFLKQFNVIAKLEDDKKTSALDLNCNFSISKETFIDGSLSLKDVSFATFTTKQALTDKISGNLNFLGSLDNLLLQANLESLTMHVFNKPLEASCMFLIDDGTVRIPDAHVNWNGHNISSINVNFNPASGTGALGLKYAGTLSKKAANAEIKIDIAGQKVSALDKGSSVEKIMSVIESFVLNTTLKNANLGEQKLEKPFVFTVTRDNGVIAIYDSENKITGFYMDDGTLSLNMSKDLKTHVSFDGNITSKDISLQCYDINIDIPQVCNFINLRDYVAFTSGSLNGSLLIDGKLTEPKFFGTLYLDNVNFNSPGYAPDNLYANNIPVVFSEYKIEMPRSNFIAKTFVLWAECTSEFEGWIPYDTVVHCGIDKEKPGHIKTNNLLFHADGKVSCDITMKITPESMDLQGNAAFDKGEYAVAFDTFDDFISSFSGGGKFKFTMDLGVTLGNNSEFNWPNMKTPILRTLTSTSEPIAFHVEPGLFTMTGLANLRGGEITYIKRNFYIKEGNIKFVETMNGFVPLLTLRAEIRDKDLDGKPVKLIMNMKDQSLINNSDTWISKITADPAKSETEVLQLLGQVVTGETTRSTILKDTLTNATDLVSQITFAKNIENKIRDFLHLDVLSFRTQVVQNLVFGNLFKKPEQESLKLGDYLDNTSFYIGKYFGSAIYADAALHLSNYDQLKDPFLDTRKPVYKSILFQPELGLEMATPFFNLRWAISPTNLNTLFVDNTSLTFSWNFSY